MNGQYLIWIEQIVYHLFNKTVVAEFSTEILANIFFKHLKINNQKVSVERKWSNWLLFHESGRKRFQKPEIWASKSSPISTFNEIYILHHVSFYGYRDSSR